MYPRCARSLVTQLAASLTPSEVVPGVAVAMLTGKLENNDNHYMLKVHANTKLLEYLI